MAGLKNINIVPGTGNPVKIDDLATIWADGIDAMTLGTKGSIAQVISGFAVSGNNIGPGVIYFNNGTVGRGWYFPGGTVGQYLYAQQLDEDQRVYQDGVNRYVYQNFIVNASVSGTETTLGTLIGQATTANLQLWKTPYIGNSSITGDMLQDEIITPNKIADGSITEDKLGVGSVITDTLADDSVTESKIVTGAVTANKISGIPNRIVNVGNINEMSIGGYRFTSFRLRLNFSSNVHIFVPYIGIDPNEIFSRIQAIIVNNIVSIQLTQAETFNGSMIRSTQTLFIKTGEVTLIPSIISTEPTTGVSMDFLLYPLNNDVIPSNSIIDVYINFYMPNA